MKKGDFAMPTYRLAEITETDREIGRALQVVHKRFGGDLRVFFSHIKDLHEKSQTGEDVVPKIIKTSYPKASGHPKS